MKKNQLKFNKTKHKYTYNGKELISVTTYIKQFFPEFDAKGIARKLNKMRNTKWYRMGIRKILAQWKEQASYGTKIHEEIETYINEPLVYAKACDVSEETQQALGFWHNHCRKLNKPSTYPELRVFNEELGLAGTIDVAIYHTLDSGEVVVDLIDWKVTKDLTKTVKLVTEGPLAEFKVQDNKLSKYSLQLNLYKRILELGGVRVNKMFLAKLDKDGGIEIFDVYDLGVVIDKILGVKK